jgi:hypothetical protein
MTESAMADSATLAGMMDQFQSMSPSMAERNYAETEQSKQQTRLAKARFELSPSLRRAERKMAQREKERDLSNSRKLGMSWGDRPSLGSMVDSQQNRVNEAQAKREEARQAREARSLSYQQIKQPAASPASIGKSEPSVTQTQDRYVNPNGNLAARNVNIVTGKYGIGVGKGVGETGGTLGGRFYRSREEMFGIADEIARSSGAPGRPAPRMTSQSAVQPKKNPLMPN